MRSYRALLSLRLSVACAFCAFNVQQLCITELWPSRRADDGLRWRVIAFTFAALDALRDSLILAADSTSWVLHVATHVVSRVFST